MNNSKGNKLRNLDFLSKKFFNFERKNVYLTKNEQNELNKIPFLSRFQNKFNLSIQDNFYLAYAVPSNVESTSDFS